MERKEKIMSAIVSADWVKKQRDQHQTVVMTNGCFDILHRGHVDYLEYARSLGSLLIVAVNSDDSVRLAKGTTRPINPLEDRLSVLAGLESVSCLVPFAEATPVDLVATLRPDIYVKGGDYRFDQLPEAAIVLGYGGEVHLAPFVDGQSTSATVHKILQIGSLP